jgi:ribonuclease BN (tRNA processing enzyme)
MKLVLLGTGGYFPTVKRQTACVAIPEINVVLDAGSGMYRFRKNLQGDRLDIFLSHAHLDHVMGLTYLLNLLPDGMLERTTVHGASEHLEAVRENLFAQLIFPVAAPFRVQPLDGPCSLPGGGTLTSFPMKHPGGSVGYRLDWPSRSMAYITDTTAELGAAYVEKIKGVDLLLHESYFAEDGGDFARRIGHSWLSNVVDVAAAANVGRLVLIHIDPMIEDDSVFDLQKSRRTFGNVEIAYDQMELEF